MKYFVIGILFATSLQASLHELTLEQAIIKLKNDNLEINIAKLDETIASLEHEMANGHYFGSLDVTQSALRSNDALSVFGFKLQSREATFGDFGFSQFDASNPNVLNVMPNDLNKPKPRNHFQTTLEYTMPLYTGGKLEAYAKITQALKGLKSLDHRSMIAQKIFEAKKAFYTLSLMLFYEKELEKVLSTAEAFEKVVHTMHEEGYAKKSDLLEVKAKKSDINRFLSQTRAHQELLRHFLSFLLNEEVMSIVPVQNEIPLGEVKEEMLLERNLEIQKASKGLEMSRHMVEVQKSAFLPTIGLFAQYGSGDDRLWNDFSQKDAYTLGLQLRWNLFRGGVDSKALEKSRVENLKAQQQLSLAQKGTLLKWKNIMTQIINDGFEIESLKEKRTLAKAIYDNYAGRYHEKLVPIHEVLMKQSEEISAVLALREVQNRRNEKIFELETLLYKE